MPDQISPFELEGVDAAGNINTYSSAELTDDALLVMGVYVYDFSPICKDQMCDISELEWLNLRDDVNVVGMSGDGPYSHQKFIENNHIGYPLLCDTAEEVMADLDVLHEEKDGLRKVPKRSMFIIDEGHEIRWRWVADDNWDEWDSGPLAELNNALTDIREGTDSSLAAGD